MNLQALAAMDDCEHATGKTLAQWQTPKEIIGEDGLRRLKAAGYAVVQVVSTGNVTSGAGNVTSGGGRHMHPVTLPDGSVEYPPTSWLQSRD